MMMMMMMVIINVKTECGTVDAVVARTGVYLLCYFYIITFGEICEGILTMESWGRRARSSIRLAF